MPLTAPTAALAKVSRGLTGLAQVDGPGRMLLLKNVQQNVKALVRNEYASATSPSGATWQKTVRGKQALLSKKIPNMYESRIERGVIVFVAYSAREWLLAQQEGRVFSARHVAAKTLVVNKKSGRILSRAAFAKALDKRMNSKTHKRSYTTRQQKSHAIRARILPARPSVPESSALPALWGAAVSAGVTQGMAQWASGLQQ